MGEEEEGRYVARLAQEIDESGKESSIALGGWAFCPVSLEFIEVVPGCFAHYATLRQHDANFARYEQANEWLLSFDTFSGTMYNNGDFAVASYLPYTLVPFYPLFQERGGPRVERNQADWEVTPPFCMSCDVLTAFTEPPTHTCQSRNSKMSIAVPKKCQHTPQRRLQTLVEHSRPSVGIRAIYQ